MAYDLHIGSSLSSHKYRVGISDARHFELFSAIRKTKLAFPMILKMEDYFEDAKLSGTDLERLRSEIKRLREKFSLVNSILATLGDIDKTALEAIEKGYFLYGFCD